MKRLIALLFILPMLALAGPFDDQLRTDSPRTGRIIAEDGTITNMADVARQEPRNIARGLMPGARPFVAYGERTSTGAEVDTPVWPDGAISLAPYNAGVTIQSSNVNDAATGTGIQAVHIDYVRRDYTPVNSVLIELNGTTPVPINDPQFLFMQCMHVAPGRAGSGLKAAGDITAKNGAGTVTYSEIATGALRCSSSFRIVPKDKNLFIDTAVGSSVSLTADTTTLLRIVANRLEDDAHVDPFLLIPQASIGVQNNAVSASFPASVGPFPPGTVVGCTHTSNKAAIVSCGWFGRLEPVP